MGNYLVVDDEPVWRGQVSRGLGRDVDEAATYQDALRLIDERVYRGYVFDERLKDPEGRTGLDLLEAVRGKRIDAPCVILSATLGEDPGKAARAKDLGALVMDKVGGYSREILRTHLRYSPG